jgi:pimeloyl-ACP methyl ester carboxylesterase
LKPLGIAGLTVICVLFASCAGSEPVVVDRMIDVGTHSLHARISGSGSPAIVVDTGIAGMSDEWLAIQERLSGKTTVVLYDRAGYGRSEPGPLPRDAGREMDELKSLLDTAEIPGPYILVGHSLGGLNVQVFASMYPDHAAGMVLLDPPPIGWLEGDRFSELLETAEGMTAEWQAIADRGVGAGDPGERAQAAFFRMIASEHREMLGKSRSLVSDIESFGDIPVTVIASGVPNPMFGEVAEDYQVYWIEQSRELSKKSSRGEFILAENSTHRLHEEAAGQVVASILAVLSADNGRLNHDK